LSPELQSVMIFKASSTQAAEMMALVEAIAGMMFLTTPCVSWYVTPWTSAWHQGHNL